MGHLWQAPERLIASCTPDPATGERSNPICIDGPTAMKLLWYCSSWPPLAWLLIVGNLVALEAARKKYAWHFDLQWSTYETKLRKRTTAQWMNATQRAAKEVLDKRRNQARIRNKKR